MKIIYGSTNQGKIDEIKKLFRNHGIETEVLSLKDINFTEKINENGTTFEENSIIKAKAIKEFCNNHNINEIIITDDAGLCVDALNGRPGVHSARYVSENATQEEKLNALMEELKDVPKEKRTAKFVCFLTALLPNGEIVTAQGVTEGTISETIGTMGGLTYGPVLIPKGYNRVMNDLTDKERETTHREKAIIELIPKLNIKKRKENINERPNNRIVKNHQ